MSVEVQEKANWQISFVVHEYYTRHVNFHWEFSKINANFVIHLLRNCHVETLYKFMWIFDHWRDLRFIHWIGVRYQKSSGKYKGVIVVEVFHLQLSSSDSNPDFLCIQSPFHEFQWCRYDFVGRGFIRCVCALYFV